MSSTETKTFTPELPSIISELEQGLRTWLKP